MSKSLIQMHGGTLRIDSELGEGTTVSFTLPYKPRLMSGIEEGEESLLVPETAKPTDTPSSSDDISADISRNQEAHPPRTARDNPLETDAPEEPLIINASDERQESNQEDWTRAKPDREGTPDVDRNTKARP